MITKGLIDKENVNTNCFLKKNKINESYMQCYRSGSKTFVLCLDITIWCHKNIEGDPKVWLVRIEFTFFFFSIIQGFWTILFIFIAVFTTLQLMCPLAFFRCFLSNLRVYTELRTTSFIQSMGSLALILLCITGYKC